MREVNVCEHGIAGFLGDETKCKKCIGIYKQNQAEISEYLKSAEFKPKTQQEKR